MTEVLQRVRVSAKLPRSVPLGAAQPRPRATASRPLAPSSELAAIVGDEPLTRSEIVKRLWAYIREHGLQDPADRRIILPDDRLRAVFGRDRVHMLTMMGLLAPHLRAS